jgi:hypothetical protein
MAAVQEAKVTLHSLSMLIGVTVLVACATAPPPKPAITASADGTARAAAAPSAAKQSTQTAKSGDPNAELHNYARAQGYKSVTRNHKQVWCRQEATLGSHFETEYCLTDAVLADQKRMIEENQQDMIHNYRPSCIKVNEPCSF